MKIGTITTIFGTADITVARYSRHSSLCVAFGIAEEGFVEPFGTLSLNIPDQAPLLARDELFVKTWNANERLIAPALATGLFSDTGRKALYGLMPASIWKLNVEEDVLDQIDAEADLQEGSRFLCPQ